MDVPVLTIRLFGGLQLVYGDEPWTELTAPRQQSILAYLLLHRDRPQTRSRIAFQFWPDRSEKQALTNLRKLLHHLRRALPEIDRYLVIQRNAIHWRPDPTCEVDVWLFEDSLRLAEKAYHAGDSVKQQNALVEAIAQYSSALLPGLYEDWVLAYREQLSDQYLQSLARLSDLFEVQGDHRSAIQYIERLLRQDPLHEESYRRLMQLYAGQGNRAAALNVYQTCETTLARELGVEPAQETREVFESLLEIGQRALSPDRLPSQVAPFVGRELQIEQLLSMLADPDVRMITLAGPGGIGKTSLSVQVALHCRAEQPLAFPQGIFFVSLDGIENAAQLPARLAEAAGFTFLPDADPLVQLGDFLRDRDALLILDGFEGLLSGADQVAGILEATRKLKLLFTSRERLKLQEEHVFKVDSLSYPPSADGKPDTPVSHPFDYSAMRLFEQRAQQVRPDFTLSAQEAPWVARICQIVEGLPLGIEIAASWVRSLTCQEIADEIARDLDFLTSRLQDRPPHHRSLRAVFDRAWSLLSQQEQDVLGGLSVFRGGFDREAARQVSGATVHTLADLVDKSLLRWNPAGRYEVHDLLRVYAAERLGESLGSQRAVSAAHGHYYAGYLAKRGSALEGSGQQAALREIAGELHNVRSAWDRAVEAQSLADVEGMAVTLYRFYDLQSWFAEGYESLAAAAGRIGAWADPAPPIYWNVLARASALYYRLGHYARAEADLDRCRAAFNRLADRPEQAFVMYFLGNVALRIGRYRKAQEHLNESLDMYRELDDRRGIAEVLHSLGEVLRLTGEYSPAVEKLSESLAIRRALKEPLAIAEALNNLGLVYIPMGRYDEARACLTESLEIRQELDDRWGVAKATNNLGLLAARTGDYENALASYQQSLEIRRDIGNPFGIALAVSNLGSVLTELGRYEGARQALWEGLVLHRQIDDQRGIALALHRLGVLAAEVGDRMEGEKRYLEAMDTALKIDGQPMVLDAMTALAQLWIQEGEPGKALVLLAVAMEHPATAQSTRQVAEGLWVQASGHVESAAGSEARAQGQLLGLEGLAARLLAELSQE